MRRKHLGLARMQHKTARRDTAKWFRSFVSRESLRTGNTGGYPVPDRCDPRRDINASKIQPFAGKKYVFENTARAFSFTRRVSSTRILAAFFMLATKKISVMDFVHSCETQGQGRRTERTSFSRFLSFCYLVHRFNRWKSLSVGRDECLLSR